MKTCQHYKSINIHQIEQKIRSILDIQVQICHSCDTQLCDDLKTLSRQDLEALVKEHTYYLEQIGLQQAQVNNHSNNTAQSTASTATNSTNQTQQQQAAQLNNSSSNAASRTNLNNQQQQQQQQKQILPSRIAELEEKIDLKYKNGVLICLHCLTSGCGRYEKKHALAHHEENKDHLLVLQSKSMNVWCYECDEDLATILTQLPPEDVSDRDELSLFLEQLHELFNRVLGGVNKRNKNNQQNTDNTKAIDIKQEGGTQQQVQEDVKDSEYTEKDIEEFHLSYRGLKNLGNTCFFNSTLQCLNASRDFVLLYALPKQHQFPFKNANCMNVLLRTFFFDVRNGKGSFNPSPVFSGICRRNSTFRGFQQQDAHDLLVNFLDMLVLEHDQLIKRTKQEKMRGLKKSFVEDVFGSFYLNSVLCLDCMRVSRTRDPTFDMSVTISFKQQGNSTTQKNLKKILSQNNNQITDKSQQESIENKNESSNQRNSIINNSNIKLMGFWSRVFSFTFSKCRPRAKTAKEYERPNIFYPSSNAVQNKETTLDKQEDQPPHDQNKNDTSFHVNDQTDQNLQQNNALNHDNMQTIDQNMVVAQGTSSISIPQHQTIENVNNNNNQNNNIDTTATPSKSQNFQPMGDQATIILGDNLSQITDKQSASTYHAGQKNNVEQADQMSSVTPKDRDTIQKDTITQQSASQQIKRGHMMFEDGKRFAQMYDMEKTPCMDDVEKNYYFEPTPRAQFDDNTLEGCLYNAVRVESLVDKQNLYLCEQCTEDKYGKKSKKQHRTQALKRLIMIDPPKNLIINLKRFTQMAFTFSKNSKRISFPLLLNLDDFMIHQINKQDTDLLDIYQKATLDKDWVPKYQYRLYGVVCHSGSMSGGHYVAYTSYNYQGKKYWFYMSDSFVEQVDEKQALNCEAYILFYQRVLPNEQIQ
eukprot:403351801